jgi:glycosyltransferase involved in cell wall biosynthesis
MNRKVLIIVENLPVPFDRRVWMEATTLRKNGYHVSIICPKGKGFDLAYEELEGIHIYRHSLPQEVSSTFGYIREYSVALWHEWHLSRKIYKEQGFDVIHACNPPDLIFLIAVWFKVFHKTKFIFDHHDLNPELFESKFGKRGIMYQVLKIFERLTFAVSDIVISTNESYRKIAIERGKKKREEVFVVRSGPDLDKFTKKKMNDDFKRGKNYLIGYVGIMGEFDGLDHLINVAEHLIKERKRSDIHFCLIGGGPMLESLKKMVKVKNLEDYVEFTGFLTTVPLLERLSACDVCVVPDPKNDYSNKCTMNKILEYMALEIPIVQYDLDEGRFSAGDASLYAEPNDYLDFSAKLEKLLNDNELRKKMGKIGRERMVEKFGWKYQKINLLNAYSFCLN